MRKIIEESEMEIFFLLCKSRKCHSCDGFEMEKGIIGIHKNGGHIHTQTPSVQVIRTAGDQPSLNVRKEVEQICVL